METDRLHAAGIVRNYMRAKKMGPAELAARLHPHLSDGDVRLFLAGTDPANERERAAVVSSIMTVFAESIESADG